MDLKIKVDTRLASEYSVGMRGRPVWTVLLSRNRSDWEYPFEPSIGFVPFASFAPQEIVPMPPPYHQIDDDLLDRMRTRGELISELGWSLNFALMNHWKFATSRRNPLNFHRYKSSLYTYHENSQHKFTRFNPIFFYKRKKLRYTYCWILSIFKFKMKFQIK